MSGINSFRYKMALLGIEKDVTDYYYELLKESAYRLPYSLDSVGDSFIQEVTKHGDPERAIKAIVPKSELEEVRNMSKSVKERLLEVAGDIVKGAKPDELETVQINETQYDDGSVGVAIELTYPAENLKEELIVDGKKVLDNLADTISKRKRNGIL